MKDKIRRYLEHPFSFCIAALLVVTLWSLWGLIVNGLGLTPPNEAGPFGDMFGSLNTLFTGLAFAAVAWSMIIQHGQLKDARMEINAAKADRERDWKHRELERFDTTFFNLLQNHLQLVASLRLQLDNEPDWPANLLQEGEGRAAIAVFNTALCTHLIIQGNETWRDITPASFSAHYDARYGQCESCMGHYFRSLYQLVKFVKTCPDNQKKYFYMKVLRAQLSSDELLALFFNGLFWRGENFKDEIEAFGLLEHFPGWIFPTLRQTGLYLAYADTAFQDPDIQLYQRIGGNPRA